MNLPEDMAPALADGVVLCHLANNLRPRSVSSIHVPSPTVVIINRDEMEFKNLVGYLN